MSNTEAKQALDNQTLNHLNKPLLTILIMAATVMQTLDTTIANVALPRMQGTLSATQDEIAWVLTSYIVTSAITILFTGWMAERFGRKKVFLLSIAGFTVTSILCGIATSLPEIVLFRSLQGISGAGLIPLSQAILFDINPPKEHGKAMAIWGIGVMMGPVLGPLLGGWLTESYNWRWVFYINVPIGILTFLGLLFSLPETRKEDKPFDFFGFISLSLGIGALQILLDRGERQDWFNSSEIIIETILSGIGFYLFLIHTLTHARPFLTPRLFINRNFVNSTLLIFLVGLVLYATLALLPPLLQQEMNYPVFTTGLVTAPRGLGTMFSMLIVSKLILYIDNRLLAAAGLGAMAFSLWQMAQFNLQMDEWPVIISGFVQGFGLGLAYVPISTIAFSTLPVSLRTEGTSFFNLSRSIGSSIGISIVEAMLSRKTQILHASLAEHITPYNLNHPVAVGDHVVPLSQIGLPLINEMVTQQANLLAYLQDFKWMMIATLVVIPLVLLLHQPSRQSKTDEPVAME